MGGRQGGFTLLEMLVALTVFALISAIVYSGQRAVLATKEVTERQALHLKQLQGALALFAGDITQHVLRGVRDEFGDSQPPLASADYGAQRLSLTRAGWQNPLNLPRSTLQRVAYGIEDEQLLRYSWPMLDRVQGSEPFKMVLLEGVRTMRLRFLTPHKEWVEQWPPQASDELTRLMMPLAVELTLELDAWGSFRRVVPTAGWDGGMQGPLVAEGQP